MLGISTASFYGRLTTEDSIYKISELGISCAEVFLNTFSEYSCRYINMVSERLKHCDILFNSVHTLPTQFEPQLFSDSDRQKKDAFDFLKNVLQWSSNGGCGIYVMHGKPFYKKNVEGYGCINVDKVAANMKEICLIAKDYNIDVALENVHWAMCNNLDVARELFYRVPELKFTLDIKQAYFSNERWQDYIDIYGSRLCNIHICDYKNGRTCLPGKGEFDFVQLRDKLDEVKYRGNIILEIYSPDYSDYKDIIFCVDYLKDIFGSC